MAVINKPSLAERLRAAASKFVQVYEHRAKPLATAAQSRDWNVFAFGGVPRGMVASGGNYIPRDLDLVFDDQSFEEFSSIFSAFVVRKTRFGGLNLSLNGLDIDAWPLSATWAFRENIVEEPCFANLPKTTFLNFDGALVQFTTRRGQAREVYADGLEKVFHKGLLDIELLPNPFPALCVVRTLKLSNSNMIPLAPRLAEYCYRNLSKFALDEFVEIQVKHYGSVFFSAESLVEIRNRLEFHLEENPIFGFHLTKQYEFWDGEIDYASE